MGAEEVGDLETVGIVVRDGQGAADVRLGQRGERLRDAEPLVALHARVVDLQLLELHVPVRGDQALVAQALVCRIGRGGFEDAGRLLGRGEGAAPLVSFVK